jgi:hypothetical protein
VSVRLADSPERHLAHLGTRPDDDDPLAEDPIERAGQALSPDARQAVDQRDERVLLEVLHLDLEFHAGRTIGSLEPARRAQRSEGATGGRDARGEVGDRRCDVIDDDVDRNGRRLARPAGHGSLAC